jgi:hypothetical protein
MNFYLQFGHGMMGMSKELLTDWGAASGVVISPRDVKPAQVQKVAHDSFSVGAEPLFDPQCYVHDSNHENLLGHSFYKTFLNAGSGSLFEPQTISEILKHLAESNAKAGIHRHILPGRLADPVDADWFKFQQLIIDSAQARFGGESLIATVALSQASVESEEQVEAVVEAARSWQVQGYYVVCENQREYLSENPLWLGNVLILVSGLKLLGVQVIVGYGNQQLLAVASASVDVLCSGNFLNTRSFSRKKFYLADEESTSRRATWYYCPQAYSEFKIPYLDLAKGRGVLSYMRPTDPMPQEFCFPLEGLAFRHYLASLRVQSEATTLSSYRQTRDRLLQSLDESEELLQQLKREAVLGGDRAFSTDVSAATRSALTQLDSARGLQLERAWNLAKS